MWKRDGKQAVRLIWGLFLCGAGIYCMIQANIGLAPWEALSMGISMRTGMLFGDATLWSGVVVVALDLLLREKIGVGTVLNALLIGKFTDFLAWVDVLPQMQNFWSGVALMLVGQVIMCTGTYFYMSCGWGCGPRDSLVVALNRRTRRIPIGAARFCVEGTVLILGWLLGAPVGLGTVLAMFGVSFILQGVFAVFHFSAKSVCHEGVFDTLARYRGRKQPV